MKRFFSNKSLHNKFLFVFLGIGSTIWFLVRVLPKPSRAAYPCMRAAAPFMSGLVLYILGVTGGMFAFRKMKEFISKKKTFVAVSFACLALLSGAIVIWSFQEKAVAQAKLAVLESPNSPEGTPKGYWPGRVVWVMDKNATEDLNNDFWYLHTNQDVVRRMLADGIKKYADTTSTASAWKCIFRYFNREHGRGWRDYKAGEKIMIKINTTNLGAGGRHLIDWMDATPEMVLALLENLVDTVGVAQADITIGDPYRGFADEYYDLCHTKYPNIHYIEGMGGDGREQTEISSDDVFFTSDGNFQSRLPQAYLNADYFINMPCLKTHDAAGITIAAKNHQGSVIAPGQDASSQYMGNVLHYDYPNVSENQTMGIYRHIVDYMAHSKLGGNTLIYIVDAIWSGRNWEGRVDKFGMAPFSDDYTSSMFISQDAVAIESVGFDFLYNEYKDFSAKHGSAKYPLWEGVQDYIHQAASPANWPSGIQYDPDHADHSSPIGSLGVHEHWNNTTDKKYSVNLTGEKGGIHLVTVPETLIGSAALKYNHETGVVAVPEVKSNQLEMKLYPNPVIDFAKIQIKNTGNSSATITICSLEGKTLKQINFSNFNGDLTQQINLSELKSGIYYCKLVLSKGNTKWEQSCKFNICK